jgi:hypothetical protein
MHSRQDWRPQGRTPVLQQPNVGGFERSSRLSAQEMYSLHAVGLIFPHTNPISHSSNVDDLATAPRHGRLLRKVE